MSHCIKIFAKFANSVDLDEVAHNEPPHLGLICLCPVLVWTKHFLKFNLQT